MLVRSEIICSITVCNLLFSNMAMEVKENTCIKEGLECIVEAAVLLL